MNVWGKGREKGGYERAIGATLGNGTVQCLTVMIEQKPVQAVTPHRTKCVHKSEE